eukprot:3281558-Amphidinium_carterae.1
MPQMARMRGESRLVPSEWIVPVRHHTEISAVGTHVVGRVGNPCIFGVYGFANNQLKGQPEARSRLLVDAQLFDNEGHYPLLASFDFDVLKQVRVKWTTPHPSNRDAFKTLRVATSTFASATKDEQAIGAAKSALR